MNEELPRAPTPSTSVPDDDKTASARTITNVVYALQAISFLVGFTFIVAVVINYVKRSDVRGTWLESHFRWQIRTFWFGLLWLLIGTVTVYILVGYVVLVINATWIIYRIARGWLRVSDRREMYVTG